MALNETLADFVSDPDCPFAVVVLGQGVSLYGTRANLAMALAAAKNAKREHPKSEVVVHQHNGREGWEAGTVVVARS